jgi:parallel beta-helix repeat protein
MLNDSLKQLLILPLVCISLPYTPVEAANPSKRPPSKPPCNQECQPLRISARHIENKGIGYNTGYTTLEAFLAAPTDLWAVMPFVDLRGHIFNDGHWAANGGVGLRSLMKDRVYGAYAYYDYRDTQRKGYNQVSFGLETLGTLWDLRLNGYAVVGDRRTRPYHTQFSQFAGNNIYYTQKFQYALSGGNAEVGFYPLKMQDFTLYTGIGPYYLKGPARGAVWGGETRIKFMWKEYVGAELSYSYDHTFKNIVQGQVFLSLPLGPKGKVRESKKRSCIDNYLLCQRMIEPVVKHEIIPVTTKKSKNLAINPATGHPYTVYFVNNLSHSAGTYKSPFSTLAAAENASEENDLIYVYPGDLKGTGLSSGVTLKNGQQLLGATINQDLMTTAGQITLPAQASGSNAPLLSNGAGAVVTLGDNNVVSGLYIQNTAGPGILASGSSNATLTQNYVQGNSRTYNGIELDNVTGSVSVSSNTIMYQAACVNIDNTNSISNASYLFTNNTLHSEDGNYGFNITYIEGSNNYFLSSNNNIYASQSAGINISCSNTANNTPHVFDIIDCNFGTDYDYAVELTLNNNSIAELNVQNSKINSSYGVYTISNNQSQLTVNIANNSFNVYAYAFEPETHNTSFTNAIFTNNSINCYDYPIYIDSLDSSTIAVNISNNTMNSYEYSICTDLAGSANLTGTIKNNTLNPLYYAIYTDMQNSAHFGADINDNAISSGYYHIYISQEDSSSYTGDIIGNTFVGQDDDDTILWKPNTSGIVSSIISKNLFTGNYDALDLINLGTGTTTFEILNNTIQNSSGSGIYLTNSGTSLQATVSGNTFQGFATNAVSVTNSAGEMCLQFNNNTSNPYPNAYVIDATGGTLNLVTPSGNLGQLETTGTTPVTQCP